MREGASAGLTPRGPPTIVGAMTRYTDDRAQRPAAGRKGRSCAAWILPLLLAAAGAVRAAPPATTNQVARITDASIWKVVKAEEMDAANLLPGDHKLLADGGIKWKHAQTEHFVIHYEMELFALKVAHMAEFFYGYIAKDLQGAQDRIPGRSHLFIFRTETRWKKFLESVPEHNDWTYSFVYGPSLYLQQSDNRNRNADVLAHEMTHLVVNRFLPQRLPLWLNEGIAEYYGEFAFAAFRGTTRNPRVVFKLLRDPLSLQALTAITQYPDNTPAVHRFYESAKYFVGFLLTKKPHEKFQTFLAAVCEGKAVETALQEVYGFTDFKAAEKEFARFCR